MIKILFLADTHIGFDWSSKPRIKRRRRGDDFYRNYLLALKPAFNRQVDLVIHGGDLLYRSKVPAALVSKAFEPLQRVADLGIPVYIVPGNHERSQFRLTLFEKHPLLKIFDKPRTYGQQIGGLTFGLSGFPFIRDNIRSNFKQILAKTNWQKDKADIRLLCMHHPVDGATVGPANFMFRSRMDTICPDELPAGFDAVLSGHIHRHQVITKNLAGKPLALPVYYPGSIERTAFAERNEDKGYLIFSCKKGNSQSRVTIQSNFIRLPARPMHQLEIDVTDLNAKQFDLYFTDLMEGLPADSILKIRIVGALSDQTIDSIKIARLRSIAPQSMNLTLSLG